jgi:uncharacterized membrane protein
VGGGFALYYLSARWLPRRDVAAVWRVAWGVVAVVVLGAALLYPLQATFSRTNGFDGPRGLDGLAWAAKAYPGDYKAARWLAENVDGQKVVVEMVGSQSLGFEYSIAGRISGWTGHTTILAWPGHERQWRGSYKLFEGRQGDVDRLYTTESTAEVTDIVRKYNVDYIYVGELERQTYPAAALEKFDGMYGVAYREGDVVIYRVKGTR